MQLDPERPLRVAIIGAGPAGFYAAQAPLKGHETVAVDLFERLPSPYGLVRYLVAPDHDEVKSKAYTFEQILKNERVRYFGNVTFGRDLTHAEVRGYYKAVIYTVGASVDKSLGIPGEDLYGSMSATEFVAWYNAHPDHASLNPPLDTEHVAVVGMGNVALDVTRALLKDPDELARTDMADYAVEGLRRSRVTEVHILGRRGPSQASFTPKELREVAELPGVEVIVDPADVAADRVGTLSDEIAAKKAARNLELFTDFAERKHSAKKNRGKRVHVHFFVSPVAVLGDGRVQVLRLERNRLEGQRLSTVGTGAFSKLETGLLLRSVGYRSKGLPGAPFDEKRGVIPNVGGRVTTLDGEVLPGEYTSGWVRRGASGVIGTNKIDAEETVRRLLEDLPGLKLPDRKVQDVDALLEAKGVRFVDRHDWQRIGNAERRNGSRQHRRSLKFASVEAMLAVLGPPGSLPSQ